MPLSVSQQVQQPVEKRFLGTGDQAIFNTLKVMREIVLKSAQNYYIRRWAETIVKSSRSNIDRVHAVFDFIAQHTRYLRDPHGFEFIKTPPVSLQLIEVGEIAQLDCDDFTVLSLSLLKSIGFNVTIKAIAIREDKKFSHVYGLVEFERGKWIPIDLTKPETGFGWEWPTPTRITELKV